MTITATKHNSAHEAIQHLSVSGDDHAVMIGDGIFSTTQETVEAMDEARCEYAFICEDKAGRIVTVPVYAN
jgi:hypothetical protein